MGSQRVGHDWATELNWIFFIIIYYPFICQWAFRLVPCLVCCNSAAVNTEIYVPFQVSFLQIYAQEWDCRSHFWLLYWTVNQEILLTHPLKYISSWSCRAPPCCQVVLCYHCLSPLPALFPQSPFTTWSRHPLCSVTFSGPHLTQNNCLCANVACLTLQSEILLPPVSVLPQIPASLLCLTYIRHIAALESWFWMSSQHETSVLYLHMGNLLTSFKSLFTCHILQSLPLGTIPKKAAHPSDNALIPLACSMLHLPLVLSPWSIVCKLPVYHVYGWVGLPPPRYSLKLHEVRSLCLFVHLYILCSSTSSWPICLHKYLLNEWVNELIDWLILPGTAIPPVLPDR